MRYATIRAPMPATTNPSLAGASGAGAGSSQPTSGPAVTAPGWTQPEGVGLPDGGSGAQATGA